MPSWFKAAPATVTAVLIVTLVIWGTLSHKWQSASASRTIYISTDPYAGSFRDEKAKNGWRREAGCLPPTALNRQPCGIFETKLTQADANYDRAIADASRELAGSNQRPSGQENARIHADNTYMEKVREAVASAIISEHATQTAAQTSNEPDGVNDSAIENMTYDLGSEDHPMPVEFRFGKARTDLDFYSIAPKTIVYGDLRGDGRLAAVLVMDDNGGGSGIFRSLYAVWKADGSLKNSEAEPLGDRIVVKSIKIRNRIVTVNMLTQGPDDGMCCPTQHKILRVRLQGNHFKELR